MATTFSYELSFASLPFCLDVAEVVRLQKKDRGGSNTEERAPAKYEPNLSFLDELDRLISQQYLQDILPRGFQGTRSLNNLSQHNPDLLLPDRTLKVGQWYYPTSASRWSVFRGLATSSVAKAMVASALGSGPTAKPFVVKSVPVGAPEDAQASGYTVETDMYLLPPRPIAETRGFDGLYLITIVDERWYWQWKRVSLQPWQQALNTNRTTWQNLFDSVASALGISLTVPSISSDFLYPEPDSQLWTSSENAAVLLDTLTHNLFMTLVRKFDGTYEVMEDSASQALAEENRGRASQVIRMAGGDMFSELSTLPVGDISAAKNAIVPAEVEVCFPKYIEPNYGGPGGGDVVAPESAAASPVPYLWNSRYRNKRPSAWQEDSYSDLYTKTIPIAQGGDPVAGLVGKGTHTIHSTAKAIYRTEADSAPSNQTELDTLALALAQGYYEDQALTGLDEVYPGTPVWEPEGLHDLLYTYSAAQRQASLRVMRNPWNLIVREMQHSASTIPRGVGGPTVALSVRDCFSGSISTSITLLSGSYVAVLGDTDNLPTQNRWRGIVGGSEHVLFDGTSGGNAVSVAARGIDGTTMGNWAGSTVVQIAPNTNYGTNLITHEKMQGVYPAEWTSGGLQAVRVVPQTQTVYCFDGSGSVYNGLRHFSGQVRSYDAQAGTYPSQEYIWIIERNESELRSGLKYNGQFAWYSKDAPATAPIYLVEDIAVASGQGDLYVSLSGIYQNYILPAGRRRLIIDARGRVTFPSFSPKPGLKIEIPSWGSGPIVYPAGLRNSGTLPAGVRATPSLAIPSGSPAALTSSRALDDFQYPGEARVVEYVGPEESGGHFNIENPTQRDLPRVGVASEPLNAGTPVYTDGISEGVPLLKPSDAFVGEAPSVNIGKLPVEGLVVATLASGELGEFTAAGPVVNVDTTGFTDGQKLYLKSGGGFTTALLGTNSSGCIQQRLATVLVGGSVSGWIESHVEPVATVLSGNLGHQTVMSGNLVSGVIGWPHLGSGSVLSGNIASGQITWTHIAACGVRSGNICSGQVSRYHLSDESVWSNHIASGSIGHYHLTYDIVWSGNIGSGQVASGHIASGVIQLAVSGLQGSMKRFDVADAIGSGLTTNIQITAAAGRGIFWYGMLRNSSASGETTVMNYILGRQDSYDETWNYESGVLNTRDQMYFNSQISSGGNQLFYSQTVVLQVIGISAAGDDFVDYELNSQYMDT